MSKWEPIETAPKDGSKVDLLYPFPLNRQSDMQWESEGPLKNNWFKRSPSYDGFGKLQPEAEWYFVTFPNEQPTHWCEVPTFD